MFVELRIARMTANRSAGGVALVASSMNRQDVGRSDVSWMLSNRQKSCVGSLWAKMVLPSVVFPHRGGRSNFC
jgi:hypothetical protein